MSFFDRFKKKAARSPFYAYSEQDMDRFENHIQNTIGPFSQVIHEIVSDGLHLDVLPIPATEKRNNLTLITMGMGAYPMPVPERYGRKNRAELAIRLPADWPVEKSGAEWFWPIALLTRLARLPYDQNTWFGVWHDADFQEPLGTGVEFCAVLLEFLDENVPPLELESGDELLLYNVIPLYRSEMDYLLANDAEALLNKMPEEVKNGPLNIHRKPVV
ncbi:MAG: suppressor of fused domain protein [Oscillospiraceae bacterium]|nr:suppressor of fused domain protein [Oscillospiraceae bacterium]